MRVLFTNSPLQHYHRTAFFFRDWGALNLGVLATCVEKDHEVEILDNWHNLYQSTTIASRIDKFKPDVLAISHSSEVDTESVFAMVKWARKTHPHLIIIGGGMYPSMFAEECLEVGFDYVVLGEGEKTLPELLQAINAKEDLRKVRGIQFIKDKELIKTPDRPFAKNLDDLPFCSTKYLPTFNSWFFPGKRTTVIETARGCPYKCEFCIVTSFFKRTWRKRSNDRIIGEMKRCKEQGIDHFYLLDESFGIKEKEYTELCQRIIDEKLDIKWYPSGTRTDTIVKYPELFELAAKAGMYGTLVGFESYTDKTLTDVTKDNCVDNNRRASEILRKNNIVILGVHIFGLPGEEDFSPTYREGRRLSDVFTVSMFSLLPGTPLFKRAEKSGVVRKIPLEKRVHPYSYFMGGENRDPDTMTREFMLWHLKHHVSLRMFWDMLRYRGVKRRFVIADYLSCIQYAIILPLNRLGLRQFTKGLLSPWLKNAD